MQRGVREQWKGKYNGGTDDIGKGWETEGANFQNRWTPVMYLLDAAPPDTTQFWKTNELALRFKHTLTVNFIEYYGDMATSIAVFSHQERV